MDPAFEKLARVVQAVESGTLALDVDAIYVHGPYTWSDAKRPELAILIVYRPPTEENMSTWLKRTRFPTIWNEFAAIPHFGTYQSDVMAFMKGDGQISPVLVQTPCDIQRNVRVLEPLKVGRVWSSDGNTDWRSNVRRLRFEGVLDWMGPTPLFGNRYYSGGPSIPMFVDDIASGHLAMSRLPLCDLEADVARVASAKGVALATAEDLPERRKAMPYVAAWFERHVPEEALTYIPRWREIRCESGTHLMHVGCPNLSALHYEFSTNEILQVQATLPDIVDPATDEMFVFKRGPTWVDHGPAETKRGKRRKE